MLSCTSSDLSNYMKGGYTSIHSQSPFSRIFPIVLRNLIPPGVILHEAIYGGRLTRGQSRPKLILYIPHQAIRNKVGCTKSQARRRTVCCSYGFGHASQTTQLPKEQVS